MVADSYLQFKSKKKNFWGKEKEVWRYVPDDIVGEVLGYYLTEKACPTSLNFMNSGHMVCSFSGQEKYVCGPVDFTKGYPNISVYFKHIIKKRRAYLKEQRGQKPEGAITKL